MLMAPMELLFSSPDLIVRSLSVACAPGSWPTLYRNPLRILRCPAPFTPPLSAMKSILSLLVLSTLLTLTCCSEAPEQNTPASAGAESAPEQNTPQERTEPAGTSIKVGEGGIEITSKDGSVDVAADSAVIQISPK